MVALKNVLGLILPLLASAGPLTKRWDPTWSTCSTAPNLENDTNAVIAAIGESTMDNLGAYAPYYSLPSYACRNPPDGWTVEQVQIIFRHGARNPTSGALKDIETSLKKVVGRNSSVAEWEFIKNFSYNTSAAGDLTDFGKMQLYTAGQRYAKEYASLASDYFTRADADERTVDSGEWFLQGFMGMPFSTKTNLTVDVILGVSGNNDTLDQGSCATYNTYTPDLGDTADDHWLKVFTPPISERINSALGSNVSLDDITNFMSLCSFVGMVNTTFYDNPWCHVFTDDEWVSNEYFYDLEKYYDDGWGNPYSRVLATGLVNEIVARFNSSPVFLGSGTNSTQDTNPATFPLDKTFYADFSHDNNLAPLLPALGLDWETLLPSAPPANDIPPHLYINSQVVPYAARFVFEKLKSVDGTYYVRLILNDAVVAWPYAGCGWYGESYGLCPLDAWIEAQSFARQDPPVWDQICNAPQINATVAIQP